MTGRFFGSASASFSSDYALPKSIATRLFRWCISFACNQPPFLNNRLREREALASQPPSCSSQTIPHQELVDGSTQGTLAYDDRRREDLLLHETVVLHH